MNQAQTWLEKLAIQARFHHANSFTFAEVGFTDLALFLDVAARWQALSNKHAKLHYFILETPPLLIERLDAPVRLRSEDTNDALLKELSAQLPNALPGWHQVSLLDGQIELSLFFGDLLQGVTDLDIKVDAWVLQPNTKPDNTLFGSPAFMTQLRRQSQKNTQLATLYQDEKWVRTFEKSGFHVQSNHVDTGLIAQLKGERRFSSKAPWFDRPLALKKPGSAIVVGAGLAGASVAYELAEAGWTVRVIETNKKPADGASGNLAGALHPLVTADWNLRSQWYLQGFEATLARVKPWLEANKLAGKLNGLVHLAVDQKNHQRMQEALNRVGLPHAFAHWVEPDQASKLLGGKVSQAGLFFPQAGWLNPPSVVACCLDHNNIEVVYEQQAQALSRRTQEHNAHPIWNLHTQNKIWQADMVVLAEGALPTLDKTLPIRPLKGQVTHLNPNHQAWSLKRAVSHRGYSAPAPNGLAVTGATFEAPSLDPQVSVQGHQFNLDSVASSLPDWLDVKAQAVTGRVGFRPTTPDHLPVIGGLVDSDWLESAYLSQSHTQALFKYPPQCYQRGLYISNGHGARGLMSVFLAAKIIRADVMGQDLPVVPSLYVATHPARFKIREWRRHGPI
ncbi:MAG: FAD-dependent 5-carboxymethylaminomethyl-2-thiouridine(34) oxidoreductase MnmC [Thiomicrospira sp.]|uniref:FAD-dependent 5-carboxymethylaminomethyl-2-thiouridine(34) oxidoreductase MnmC n=1 Tax=Thiomicrospira sp. TaxID=935 RepID=UPI0019E0D6DD|nr:FAD-dependent 5-carboxymethylaminomethyl-2-thiouridine(34) oxidoreductase MnmC [Thiomicrospira sp.]MBE0493819.1 FAD-dependent 5-carboxymethylaminomethyl-2-thiouridine(34) oxidoreductase MnmC [Thiomicrospira sp.]